MKRKFYDSTGICRCDENPEEEWEKGIFRWEAREWAIQIQEIHFHQQVEHGVHVCTCSHVICNWRELNGTQHMNERQHTNNKSMRRTSNRHKIQYSAFIDSQPEIRRFREANDWHRKSCHPKLNSSPKNVPEMKSDMKQTKFLYGKTQRRSTATNLSVKSVHSYKIRCLHGFNLFFACYAILKFLHCFRYYCHETKSLSPTISRLKKIQYFSPSLFRSVIFSHRLSSIRWYAMASFYTVIILSHYGHSHHWIL